MHRAEIFYTSLVKNILPNIKKYFHMKLHLHGNRQSQSERGYFEKVCTPNVIREGADLSK